MLRARVQTKHDEIYVSVYQHAGFATPQQRLGRKSP